MSIQTTTKNHLWPAQKSPLDPQAKEMPRRVAVCAPAVKHTGIVPEQGITVPPAEVEVSLLPLGSLHEDLQGKVLLSRKARLVDVLLGEERLDLAL